MKRQDRERISALLEGQMEEIGRHRWLLLGFSDYSGFYLISDFFHVNIQL